MANLRDVAKYAGVSLASASRVLAQDPTFKVSNATKENILKAAKDLDYIYKKKVTSKPLYNIGFVLALTSEKYSDPFFTSILSSAEEEGKKLGMNIASVLNYNELKSEDILEDMLAKKLDGIVLMENLPIDVLKRIRDEIPHIIGIDPNISDINTIGFDHISSTMLIMNHFISLGCDRIAYIGGGSPNEDLLASYRMIAYREALRRNYIPYDESLIKDCKWDVELCAQYTEELLSGTNPPNAIFAGSDTLASVILGKLFSMGIFCPDDVSVIGFNNLPMSSHTIPPLSTVNIPTKEIGILAMHRLLDLIQKKDDQILNILLPVELIIRESTQVKKL